MRKYALLLSVLGGVLLILSGFSDPVSAQATRTWVSGVGDDANPCSRTAPCKTFAGAISKTAAGGEISVLDPGGFGGITITKSISITNDNSGEAGILSASTTGVIVNGANVIVQLRGLVIEGAVSGVNGVRFIQGAALNIENCVIRNFRTASPNGNGVLFAPTNANAELKISNSTFADNGTAGDSSGINIDPGVGGTNARVTLSNVQVVNNFFGVRTDGANGAVQLTMTDSTVSGSGSHGLFILAGSNVMLSDTTVSFNARGVAVFGAGAVAAMANNTIHGNTEFGISVTGGAVGNTFENNYVSGNATNVNGALTPVNPS